jgi:beta-galactosidase
MPGPYPPIHPKCPRFLHGGDYNPDQWPPEIWEEDMRLMKLAHCNAMTVGVFSWVHLEPKEGKFTFGWLDRIMDKLAEHDAFAVLATPGASPPAWMSKKYPEILRVGPDRVRRLHGNRVNNCWTSPIFREKCRNMARLLAERYKDHPALLVWHVYNEYGGECYCDLCQEAFRRWLHNKFGTLDNLNAAYWTAFWGHDYTDWEHIESPGGPFGEHAINGLTLDWKRFVTHQIVDFFKNEAGVLREITPDVPVTTNLMGTFPPVNYWKLAPEMDVVSWDSYPAYHDRPGDWKIGAWISFVHDIYRTFKGGRPFMLMECSPSSQNWLPVMKLKRPGIHRLASLQAVAHGSDTVQYFQWRQSRGGAEKFHGAVVAHSGDEHTRVFRDVADVGEILEKLEPVLGASVQPEVAIVYDWENNWAIEAASGPRREGKDYAGTCAAHYRPFWSRGIPVDVPDMDGDFSKYRLLIAPMLYMVRPGVADKIEKFVQNGGVFVTTCWSGIADENDLCFTGGFPGPLRRALGLWSEEIDALYEDESNVVRAVEGNSLGLEGEWEARLLCDLIHAEDAEVLATYGKDFYAGRPAVTVNRFGKGAAYYVASRNDDAFQDAFFGLLIARLGLKPVLDTDLPEGVTAQMRTDGAEDFLFVLNFTPQEHVIRLNEGGLTDMLTGNKVRSSLTLPGYGSAVLRRTR